MGNNRISKAIEIVEIAAPTKKYAVPTFAQRLRRKLGYRWHRVEFDEDVPGCPYCMRTDVTVHLSFLDRLRFLLTGTMELTVEQRTDVQIGKAVPKTSIRIIAPGER